jgi:basic membrane protein A
VKRKSWRAALGAFATAGLISTVALVGPSLGAAKHVAATESPKVAVVLSVGLRDTGYGRSALAGINRIKSQLGLQVDAVDLVKPADFANSLSDFAQRGYGIVIADGVEFQEAAAEVAPKFPNTKFIVVNGFQAAEPNLTAEDFAWEQAGYLGGLAAGLSTKTNKIGNIGGAKIPPIERLFYGFAQGVKRVNPKAKVTISWVGSFTDPAKAKTTAQAQASRGIDVIWAIADTGNTGIFQAAKEKKIKVIGYGTDEHSLAPKNILTTTLVDYGKVIFNAVNLARSGALTPTVYVNGFKQGVLGLAPFRGSVPPAAVAKINRLAKQAEAGKVTIKKMGQ